MLARRHASGGVVVDNHQVDGVSGSFEMPLDVPAAVREAEAKNNRNGELTILFDPRIRSGDDIVKPLCLGAQAMPQQAVVTRLLAYLNQMMNSH
ncbi:FMN-dependent dehydrogenase [Niveomyces insectorum RCEF 264]|uniref:FMN-dependent dehydrogenase n=1 Tax=Niveomyces insectorum RCEF 264 TaxID=1081102 RepID=A0A162J253_9HYPO|nr:FMN-dependent dehydrogenase [Niveomyces insectorum RCEF 264]